MHVLENETICSKRNLEQYGEFSIGSDAVISAATVIFRKDLYEHFAYDNSVSVTIIIIHNTFISENIINLIYINIVLKM